MVPQLLTHLAKLAFLAQALGVVYASSPSCTTSFVQLTVSGDNQRFNTTRFKSDLDVSNYFHETVLVGSNLTSEVTLPGVYHVNATYAIWTKTCIPKNWNGVVEILVHGVAATHDYFEYANDPTYSYVESATGHGNAIVSYDRLGVGHSDHPDALAVVQPPVDIETLHQLITHIRSDSRFAKAKSFVGVGHSYGSVLLTAIASGYPTLLDNIILTGFTLSSASVHEFFLALSPSIAELQDPVKFGQYKNDTRYLVSGGPAHDLSAFFDGPHYVPGVLDAFAALKGAFSLGQLPVTGGPGASPAQTYTGGVLVVTGDHDLGFCGGNCWQKPSLTNGTSLLSDVATIFPAVTKFSTFIPANTGHATFHHFSAPQVFGVISDWLEGKYV